MTSVAEGCVEKGNDVFDVFECALKLQMVCRKEN